LIIDFDVVFPDVLGDDQIQKLSEILWKFHKGDIYGAHRECKNSM
jgi:hypothetical protein